MTELARRIRMLSVQQWGESKAVTLVGRNDAIADTLQKLVQFAQAESPVLVSGETGTGKELFARALYLLSARRNKPFLSLNCAQYNEGQLIASELFGHRRGSFTGAIADHRGVFEEANGGIVFLDEIGELSPQVQAMLLRTLGEGEIVPVGDTRPRQVNVRTIAATSRDLKSLVAAGRFRPDLYYRLRFLQLRVPPLRARGDDWEILVSHYLEQRSREGGEVKRFSGQALDALEAYHWPGNVRELRGLVDLGYHGTPSDTIQLDHFAAELDSGEFGMHTAMVLGADLMAPGPVTLSADGRGAWDALAVAGADAGYSVQSLGTQRPAGSVLPNTPRATLASDAFAQMIAGKADFWAAVRDPFMERELSRVEARRIIARGLVQSGGSYKRLLKTLGLPEGDYLRFMDFLRHHRLKPER